MLRANDGVSSRGLGVVAALCKRCLQMGYICWMLLVSEIAAFVNASGGFIPISDGRVAWFLRYCYKGHLEFRIPK